MSRQVMVPIPQQLYEQAARLGQARNQDVAAVLVEALEDKLSAANGGAARFNLAEPDEAVEREMQAYIAMHPRLKEKYLGMHVAVYGGQLIDFDTDMNRLYARIDARYPDEFVWLTMVEEEAIPTLYFRSPRFVGNE